MIEIEILSDASALATRAVEIFITEMNDAIGKRGHFVVALSGGSTPKRLYQLLAEPTDIPWDKIQFFWSDERHVPPDNPDSNFRMIQDALLSKVSLPATNVYRIKAELSDSVEVARDYEQTLINFFRISGDALPVFDLTLLGMGPDAHTASIFPGHAELLKSEKLVDSVWVEKLNTHRITLTMKVINASNSVLFLVSGEEKAAALEQVLHGPKDAVKFPAQGVTAKSVKWLVDRAAMKQ